MATSPGRSRRGPTIGLVVVVAVAAVVAHLVRLDRETAPLGSAENGIPDDGTRIDVELPGRDATLDPKDGVTGSRGRGGTTALDPKAGAPPPPARPASGARRQATLTVEVLDARGAPAPGAEVRVYGTFEWDRAWLEASVRAEARTGADGRAEVEAPVSIHERAWPGALVVHAWKGDEGATSESLDPWDPEPSRVGRATVTLRLAKAMSITGQVVSDAGLYLGGVVVKAVEESEGMALWTGSESDGSFRFPPTPWARYGGSVTLVAEEAGMGRATVTLALESGDRAPPLVLVAHRHVTGKIVDPREKWVGFSEAPEPATAHDAEFSFDVPAAGGTFDLVPAAPFAPRTVHVPRGGDVDLGMVVVEPGGEIRGRIVVEGEDPRIRESGFGWRVECARGGRVLRTVHADREGRFTIRGVGEGEHVVSTSWGSHTLDANVASGEATGVKAGDADVVLLVRRCGMLTVRATTGAGRRPAPVKGWRVEATGPSPEKTVTIRSNPDRGRDLDPDGDGFEIGVPRPGVYRVRVKIPGFAWSERDEVVVGPVGARTDAVEFVLAPDR